MVVGRGWFMHFGRGWFTFHQPWVCCLWLSWISVEVGLSCSLTEHREKHNRKRMWKSGSITSLTWLHSDGKVRFIQLQFGGCFLYPDLCVHSQHKPSGNQTHDPGRVNAMLYQSSRFIIVCVCVRTCVRACAHVCVRVCACSWFWVYDRWFSST